MDLIAHDISSIPRTEDVFLLEDVCFKDMFFSEAIYKSLTENGFQKPSPIQYKAIPLARCGFDLIVQSKSGTGKTLVFVTTALESIDLSIKRVQTIVLTPTREIALQVAEVFKTVGSHMKDLAVESFIGGLPLPRDIAASQKCHIAVGAPGRIRQLIELGHLKMDAVRLFILDEADQLMDKTFQNDINFIYWSLSEFKQMLALSATYPEELVSFLGKYMRSGKLVTPETDPIPVLKGLKQFVSLTRDHSDPLARLTDKENRLVSLLSMVKFNQCLIFSNYQSRAESTCNMLRCRGWSCEWISGRQPQEQRVKSLTELRTGNCRILVTTDLTARGIDSKGIDLVINVDSPFDPRVYLHRMGRAGRYGSNGIVITILSRGQDLNNYRQMLGLIDTKLPVKVIPTGIEYDLWLDEVSDLDEIYGLESTQETIERYKQHYIPHSQQPNKLNPPSNRNTGNKSIKTKKNNKNADKFVDKENNSHKFVSPPDLSERNFPSIPNNKNASLNDYFLDDKVDSDFLSFNDLEMSLKDFNILDKSCEDKFNSGSKENGIVSDVNREEALNGSCDKDGVNTIKDMFKSTKEKRVKVDRRRSFESIKSNESVDKTYETTEVYSNKIKNTSKMFNDKKGNIHRRRSLETKTSSVNSLFPVLDESKPVTVVTNQPARKFSYSDIAKGKRVECKPVTMSPEDTEKLKKSPLKVFPVERVSNKIEGVSISEKAINGFSKRMYSSVLKDCKYRDVNGEKLEKSQSAHFQKALFTQNTNKNISDTTKNTNSGVKFEMNGHNNGRAVLNSINKVSESNGICCANGNIRIDISNNTHKDNLNLPLNKEIRITSEQTQSIESQKIILNGSKDGMKNKNVVQSNAVINKPSIFNLLKPNVSNSQVSDITGTKLVHKINGSLAENSINITDKFNETNIENVSISSARAFSSPRTPRIFPCSPSSSNQNSFYKRQTNLSKYSNSSRRKQVSFVDSSSTESSDSEGEYIVSGSFSNSSFVRRSNLNASSRPSNSRTNEKTISIDNWFKMFYQQSSLIHNYVKYAKEFHNNQGFQY